jgi:hypothetical protein
MDSLKAECPVCKWSVESMGRDESSRAAIAAFKREHAHSRPAATDKKEHEV